VAQAGLHRTDRVHEVVEVPDAWLERVAGGALAREQPVEVLDVLGAGKLASYARECVAQTIDHRRHLGQLVADGTEGVGELLRAAGQRIASIAAAGDLRRHVREFVADLAGLVTERGLLQRCAGGSGDAPHHRDIG
jgi:hypothetical protein